MKKLFSQLSILITASMLACCSSVSDKVNDQLELIKSKAGKLDSVINLESRKIQSRKIQSLDTMLTQEFKKVRILDSLIKEESRRIDSVVTRFKKLR